MNSSCVFPIAFVLAAISATAQAGTPINETRAVDARAQIAINNVRGSITVTTWDRDEVGISGTLGTGSKELLIEGGSSRLSIEVKGPVESGWFNWGANSRMEDTLLDVKVPREAELEIEVVSANVAVSGSAGRSIDADSVSGRIRIESTARELEIGSVSGSIELIGSADRVQADTVSGEINVRTQAKRLSFETVSGRINVETDRYEEISASSVSGDISVRGDPAGNSARLSSETMSGSVRVRLPGNVSARIEAETFSGRIRTDFGTVKEPEYGPGRSLSTTVGSGDSRIDIETFSGDVDIRKE
ncbi:MAG: DUF4097 family beta strand repeat-containing protein [Dokdonella sp.]